MTSRTDRDAATPGWRIGVLYSRSGVTGTTESQHFFGTVLAVEEINALGGVLGRPLEPVVYDPRSDAEEYRRLAARLLLDDEVNVIFGGCTSHCRKAMLPVVERNNALLWYASVYEGFEYSPNIIYTGAAPNQGSMQLAAYLIQHCGKRIFLVGADYIYPRETNRIMRDTVEEHGGEILDETYLPLGCDEGEIIDVVRDIRRIRPDVVFSTLIGDDAQRFYRRYHAACEADPGAPHIPIASLTMAESEVAEIGPALCAGHITAATYFNTVDSPANAHFLDRWRARFGDRPASVYAEACYSQMHLFARALQRAGSLDTRKLAQAVHQVGFDAPGGRLTILAENNHSVLTPRIGVCRADGRFDIVWASGEPVKPDPYLTAFGLDEFWLA
ncbi:transporter substrate-binding domain-containing protein [Achromobacter ruhlandii]|jgi:branched-chain amino acid transport system substrate-binding protein|uniref:Transporter substrate-binding domain-containing protein n=1 Tax=Achromobacter ruhlandii TaxID=72557 RepID=A0A848NJJ3_9BURK|nr:MULTISPECIES: transporter substrate-binding domain-containing protein [Achromobacter]NMU91586.1 transporter substrate-binding domain-containing protein [Achromobacter ruhlandii]PJM86138.1 amino acid ABC transporter substrate-binding protein [Achromobacter ruhlandii]